jgi:DNA-binding NtrC family response regulator
LICPLSTDLDVQPKFSRPNQEGAAALDFDENDAGTLRGLRILLVDDEASILDALGQMLQDLGAIVFKASSAHAAVRIAGAQELDFAILDNRLQAGLGGVALGKALRTILANELPFIVMTGDTDPSVIRQLKWPGSSVCFKPIRSQDLLQAMVRLANHKNPVETP